MVLGGWFGAGGGVCFVFFLLPKVLCPSLELQTLDGLLNGNLSACGIITHIKWLLYLTSNRISSHVNLNDNLLRIGLVRAHLTLGVELERWSKSHLNLL